MNCMVLHFPNSYTLKDQENGTNFWDEKFLPTPFHLFDNVILGREWASSETAFECSKLCVAEGMITISEGSRMFRRYRLNKSGDRLRLQGPLLDLPEPWGRL